MQNKWIFILLGIVFGYIIGHGSFFLMIMGGILGNYLYNQFSYRQSIHSSIFPGKLTRQELFLLTSFAILGYITKSKGQITKKDILLAETLMDKYKLDAITRRKAIDAFNLGKDRNFPLRKSLKELKNICDKSLVKIFINIQLEGAFTDNYISSSEKEILHIIAEELGVSSFQLENMIMFMQLSKFFSGESTYSETQANTNQSYSSYGQQAEQEYYRRYTGSSSYQSRYSQTNHLADAYKILGISETDDKTTVKRAYRKLMNEYHPDKLVNKGLPPEMLEEAKEKTQSIQAAYDLICRHKNWK